MTFGGAWHERADLRRLVFTVVVTVGVFFRLTHLDRKVYWHDEAQTSFHVSGYQLQPARQVAMHPVPIGALDKFQHLDPRASVIDVLHSLYASNPHQAPLYFVIARGWARCFGDSVRSFRGLSAVLSVLTLPLAWWLARELFGRRSTAWVAVALLAISPVHMIYAQEARSYSLWVLAIVVSSAALLYALRRQTVWAWSAYAMALTVGLYSHLLFVLVVSGHAAYVLAMPGGRVTTALRAYVLATAAAGGAFLPWAIVVALRWRVAVDKTSWAAQLPEGVNWWRAVLVNLSAIVIDAPAHGGRLLLFLSLGMLALIAGSLRSLIKDTPARTWWFIICLCTPTLLALGLPDLLAGGRRLTISRYTLPCLLGLQLALADFLARRMRHPPGRRRALWSGVTVAVLAGGIVSCVQSWNARSWWHMRLGRDNLEVARALEQAPRPLITSELFGALLSLGHVVPPSTPALLLPWGEEQHIPADFSDVFVLYPSESLRHDLEHAQEWHIEPLLGSEGVWRLRR